MENIETRSPASIPTTFRIHPAIGIARVGDSPEGFYLAPETQGGLPIKWDPEKGKAAVDSEGNEVTTETFKENGRVLRQAVRYKIFVFDAENPEGREIRKGDQIQGIGSSGKLKDIEWTVYLANKKACWYQFAELEGEHGYASGHPLRNPDITADQERQMLIVDPGPQTVYNASEPRSARFARGENPGYAQTFPPPLAPNSVDTLGEIMTDSDLHLIVLGGQGSSGSFQKGFGHPRISAYANNDGWFDDISDGPVTAKLIYHDQIDQQDRYVQVSDPAWVIVGYPGYAPQIVDMVTLDEVVYDVAVREFGSNTYLYGSGEGFEHKTEVAPDDLDQWRAAQKRYNPEYYPYFYKEIWPILKRPFAMQWVTTLLAQSLFPHDTGSRGNFDESQISVPPAHGQDKEQKRLFREKRMYIYKALRRAGQENLFLNTQDPDSNLYLAPYMPLLCGDNPLENTLPSKFLRLTDTMLFLLGQWSEGKFINEKDETIPDRAVERESEAARLDRSALSNGLGGAFCPGGEVTWIIRNPAIYSKPYRINANQSYYPTMQTSNVATTPGVTMYERPPLTQNSPIADGIEPGDLTKYSALPWQSDFNECSDQDIDVTYEGWANTYPDNPDDKRTNLTLWWPSHRPMQVRIEIPTPPDEPKEFQWVQYTRGIPQSYAGDLKMVTAWKDLGFVVNLGTDEQPNFAEIERNSENL